VCQMKEGSCDHKLHYDHHFCLRGGNKSDDLMHLAGHTHSPLLWAEESSL
jgi:hypothetical protein